MQGLRKNIYLETKEVMKSKSLILKKEKPNWDMNRLNPRKTKVVGENVNLDEYEIVGHLISDTVFKTPELNWSHFDWAQFIQETNHPIVNRVRSQFIGFRNGQTSILICKKVR